MLSVHVNPGAYFPTRNGSVYGPNDSNLLGIGLPPPIIALIVVPFILIFVPAVNVACFPANAVVIVAA